MLLLAATAMNAQGEIVPGDVLVQLAKGTDPKAVVTEVEHEVGHFTGFQLVKEVSAPMRVWLYHFNGDVAATRDMLRVLRTVKGVQVAQVNHVVAERVVPNDPFFGQQWFHQQAQDHDIDSDLAWDITTGGFTAFGDEIVVCVIEPSGARYTQADIVDNHWVNIDEVEGNGIDDDGNGYVDDYNGWDISGNDNIGNGSHGTSVSSMVGGKGNNNLGVVGVNWDVKIMQVDMNGISEANVISAYTYPFVMRKLYRETGGEKGAYVVATNSSWGTDGGQPDDAPLWCAMYDSLGYYGILSAGSTANNDVNIDQVGDLPTACPSEFMIAVTATNNNDVRTFSGYGATTIDLGAPGEDVYLATNNGYGNQSGTSFAGPCVAGAIALLYSAPCLSFMAIANSDPALAASLIRDYIYGGVDEVSNLQNECVTGGRLNVNNSLLLMLQECSSDACLNAFALEGSNVQGTSDYLLTWSTVPAVQSINIRYRPVGSTDWIELSNISAQQWLLPALQTCTLYEVQTQAQCSIDQSGWSNSFTFTSAGCCEDPATISTDAVSEQTITLSWAPIFGVLSYTVEFTPEGGSAQSIVVTTPTATLQGLDACTLYSINVQSNCGGNGSTGSTISVYTQGCQTCVNLNYCASSGSTTYEWIDQVQIGQINNDSGNNGGYEDFSDTYSTPLIIGVPTPITLTPGMSGSGYNEYFKVWIDYNGDGTFSDQQEVAYDAGAGSPNAVTGNVVVPSGTVPGPKRMRVAMAYVSIFTGNDPPANCGSIGDGEVEDYCVLVQTNVSVNDWNNSTGFFLFPNPANDLLQVQWESAQGNSAIRLFNAQGALVMTTTLTGKTLDVSALPSGVYLLRAEDAKGNTAVKQFVKE